ncbi:TPA: hypothetical protein H2X81_000366 [Salmonella enterica]|nr:hypothetical protein [Salmonella enterica]
MIRLFSFFILLLSGCDSSAEKIGIYTVDMEYACECTSYRIFKATVLTGANKTSEPNYIFRVNEDISRAYKTVLTRNDRFLLSGSHSLSGVEVSLIFHGEDLKTAFEKTEPYYGKCYIYYFEGRFNNDRLKFDEDGDQSNEFVVDNYKFILQSPDCIKHVYGNS